MVRFSVRAGGGRGRLRFAVPEGGVLVAGSRHVELPRSVCLVLSRALARHGYSALLS